MNQLHKSSIQTEYNDTDPQGKLYRVPSFASQRLSHQDIYANKLEVNLKEMAKSYKANKPMVEQLECQRRFFKRICEKQKEKLQQVDPGLIRNAFEEELSSLREKRSKLHEMLSRLHEDGQSKKTLFVEMSNCLMGNHNFLEQSLQEIQAENEEYELILRKKKESLRNQEERLAINADAIAEKERIEEKYNLIRSEIHMREVRKKMK